MGGTMNVTESEGRTEILVSNFWYKWFPRQDQTRAVSETLPDNLMLDSDGVSHFRT